MKCSEKRSRQFLLVASAVVFFALQTCYGGSPRFFRENAFTSASFADAVNYFVTIGEASAIKELNELADGTDYTNGFSVKIRIGFVCRVLFQPRGGEPIRPPEYGWLDDLGNMGLPPVFPSASWTNISKNWPLYPVALSGTTFFILSEEYAFEGIGGPELAKNYIAYCHGNGVFRKTLIQVPTRKKAMMDAAGLRHSKAWKAIKWSDSGQGYVIHGSDDSAWNFVKHQAESVTN